MKVTFKRGKTEMKTEVTEKELKLIVKILKLVLLAIRGSAWRSPLNGAPTNQWDVEGIPKEATNQAAASGPTPENSDCV